MQSRDLGSVLQHFVLESGHLRYSMLYMRLCLSYDFFLGFLDYVY